MAATTTVHASFLTNPLVLEASAGAVALHAQTAAATPTGELLPDSVRTWLARARLLEGVPFQHLVPDAELLPPESIRFFFLDREWTDALTQGALSVGTVTTLDRDQLEGLHAGIRDEVDAEERRVRMVGGEDVGFAPAGAISGFLLRSRAVSGWPALHVRGYTQDITPDNAQIPFNDGRRMRLLRLERLAPAVLLCLFDGIPTVVHIEEPRQGVQYGVDIGAGGREVHLRNVINTEFLENQLHPQPPFRIHVPTRNGYPGVVAVKALASRMQAIPATQISTASIFGATSAVLAMEMLQFPFRQVFGPAAPAIAAAAEPGSQNGEIDAFRPTISLDEVRAWEEETA
jgi:hypothetical protein